MPKRKTADSDESSEETLPIPIQTFLWRQTSPFIRPKLGKLCEASCLSFERVLVQNILHGLSPSLCEAINSVSRWKLIQAALPHVMHCINSVLHARKKNSPDAKFDSNQTKLLYTLHWIILDAASECEDGDNERSGGGQTFNSYLHSLDTIQLFVYLFAPLISSLREEDFQSLKLENGLRLWQPLWGYQQPDVPCFGTPVKAKRVLLKAQRGLLKVNFNMANIYIGKGTSTDNIYLGFDPCVESGCNSNGAGSPLAPLAHLSDICALSNTTATSVEIVCEKCGNIMQKKDGGDLECKCGVRRSSFFSGSDTRSFLQQLGSPVDRDYITQRLQNCMTRPTPTGDVLSASYFDVAVLRCLFCQQWAEEGVYWALRYIHHRLLEVCDERQHVEYHRERSKSLPTPDILTSPEKTPCTPPSPRSPSTISMEPNADENRFSSMTGRYEQREPAFKKIRTKNTSHADEIFQDKHSISVQLEPPSEGNRPSTSMTKLSERDEDSYEEDKESGDSASDIIRRKSMPALRRHKKQVVVEDEDDDSSSSGRQPLLTKESITRTLSLKPELLKKPIITITQDSPEPPTRMSAWNSKRQSIATEYTDSSHKPLTLQRSQTDSNISYDVNEEVQEVPGSVFYILKNGEINYRMVLDGVHSVSRRETTTRTCGVLLNILNCLMDLGIVEKHEKNPEPEVSDKQKKSPMTVLKEIEKKQEKPNAEPEKEKKTAHHIAMESLVRIFRILGCPHGCGDGCRGAVGEDLRLQGVGCLARLLRIHPPYARKFLKNSLMQQSLQDIIDFLHAFLGFCVEPSSQLCSPQAPGNKKHDKASDSSGFTGYASNFGKPVGGGKGAEDKLIQHVLKPLTNKMVESRKELHSHENIGLYCDVRQFLNYVKEVHGGVFRLVALSGLLDALPHQPCGGQPKHTKIIRHTPSTGGNCNDDKQSSANDENGVAKTRRSIFRRKHRKGQNLVPQSAASDSEMLDSEGMGVGRGRLSPRVSVSATEDESTSGPSTPKRKFSKFNIAWKRAAKSDHDDDSASDVPGSEYKKDVRTTDFPPTESAGSPSTTANNSGNAAGSNARQKPRMSFRAASQATLSFLTARKKIEDGLRSWSKRKISKRGSFDEGGRRGSHEQGQGRSTEIIIIREKKLIDSYAVKSGMVRFNLMLDCCHPGSVPDPHLVAALLDLEAPVVARAAMLLECAHFVSRCNHGDWPNWMKLNLPGFRQAGLMHSRSQPSGYRRNIILQRAAGRMFHQWGEALGNHLADLLGEETPDRFTILQQVKDDSRKRELRQADEHEDFLDEATVNYTGNDCPYTLKLIACQLLLEITTFLRETYQYVPRARPMRRDAPWEKPVASRRWSSALSSPGQSERSNSRSSQGEVAHIPGSPGERKISFAVFGQGERSDSIHSSTTTISQMDLSGAGDSAKGGRRGPANKKLLRARRGSGHNASFKQRSFRLKRPEDGGSLKRTASSRARKVSTQSLKSDRSDEEHEVNVSVSGVTNLNLNESTDIPCMDSQQDIQDSPDLSEADDQDYSKYMPWIKVVVQLANTSNFICDHQNFCHPNCYERQRRSCVRMVSALHAVHKSNEGDAQRKKLEDEKKKQEDSRRETLRDKLKRRESMFQPSSPTRRRESTPLLEKIKTDANLKARLTAIMEQHKEEPKKTVKPPEETPILRYMRTQVHSLTHSPMSIISKAAPILAHDTFLDMMPVAWELLLESDQELTASSATVFLLAAVRVPDQVQELVVRELHHPDATQRINAILRFGVLWRHRWQVWPRMEDGANMFFKIPPPSIDFVLPSPTIGLGTLPVIDPPWTPHFKTKVEEVTLNQEESQKSFVTATRTRRKQQQEMIHRALLAEEDRCRAARQNFLVTTVSVTQLASDEPALHHASEDHDEAVQEELCLTSTARRMSVAPPRRHSNVNARNSSGRQGSMFWGRPTIFEGEEERTEHIHSHHMQLAQHFFPSCICAAALPIISLLEDSQVNSDGIAVSEVAEKVVWFCLVDEPSLFLRTFLEKLTQKDKQEELIFLLRKLLYFITELPAQTAHCLFNYLVGFVMFYVRSPSEGGHKTISQALSVLSQVIPSVHGIFFKDLKQTLRKEQCDPLLLITANVPSAKKLIVHGPDLSSIPSQCPINEDTQFLHILQDSLDFFNIPEDEHGCHYIIDTKTHQIHNLNSYVRDFYFFRRNHYPQLSLVKMNPDQASLSLQKQAFILKFVEIGKVLFSTAVLHGSSQQQHGAHVSFLHEELLKLPSFPRKALEADFGLYGGDLGKEVCGMDLLHKLVWTQLSHAIVQGLSTATTDAGELPLLVNVTCGTLMLHAEDAAMLRLTLSTLISTAKHFSHIFASSGFLLVMPTVLRVYSTHQANTLICQAIEFTCQQFFLLHRNPFVLQMFGSVASILDMEEETGVISTDKVSPKALFRLLLCLEQECDDVLEILDLVEGEKPLMPLDFCYIDDPDTFTMMDAINMAVTVVAYACDSARAREMLMILEALLPIYMRHLKKQTEKQDEVIAVREELATLTSLGVAVRALVCSAEALTRNFNGPQQRQLETVNVSIKLNQNHNHSPQTHGICPDEQSDFRFVHMEEGVGANRHRAGAVHDQMETSLAEFRRPRNSLLCVVAEWFTHSRVRMRQLRKMLPETGNRPPELLHSRTHNRLADIAHSLLKVAAYDAATMCCPGLQRYIGEVLPITDWSQESVRPVLHLVLRRLERLFSKMYKKPSLRKHIDWEAAALLLKGVYNTLCKFSYIAHLPHLKTLINMCLNIVLSEEGMEGIAVCVEPRVAPPNMFASAVIKLTAMQMQALGEQYSLEHICGGMSVFPSPEKTANMLLNLVLPLCILMGCGRKDAPRMKQQDISFALTVVLHALVPPYKQMTGGSNKAGGCELGRVGSVASYHKTARSGPKEFILNVAFLGLRILMVCFEKQLSAEWHRVAHCVQSLTSSTLGGVPLWTFIDFVVSVRTCLFTLLQPFVQYKMLALACETEQEFFLQQLVHQKLQGQALPHPRCKASSLVTLAAELKQLKEDMVLPPTAEMRPRASTITSDMSHRSGTMARSSSVHDLLEQQVAARMHTLTPGVQGERNLSAFHHQSSLGGPHVSPALQRKSSQRISAMEGSRILEKFTRRQSTQDEDISVCCSMLAKQVSSAHPATRPRPLLRRQARIYHRGALVDPRAAVSLPSVEECPSSSSAQPNTVDFNMNIHNTVTGPGDAADGSGDGSAPGDNPSEPRHHKLQRQDAKSRKTFKIKRHRSTIKGNIVRSATMKGSVRCGAGRLPGDVLPPSGLTFEMIEDQDQGSRHSALLQAQLSPPPIVEEMTQSLTESVSSNDMNQPVQEEKSILEEETECPQPPPPEPVQRVHSPVTIINGRAIGHHSAMPPPVMPRRGRFSKSRSQDDDVSPSKMNRGRIARQGARMLRSRSPSTSPARQMSPAVSRGASPAQTQTYVSKCDSIESLASTENSALLHREEKTHSHSSLLVYFDTSEMQDTCV